MLRQYQLGGSPDTNPEYWNPYTYSPSERIETEQNVNSSLEVIGLSSPGTTREAPRRERVLLNTRLSLDLPPFVARSPSGNECNDDGFCSSFSGAASNVWSSRRCFEI
jgi:hypothetical protein